MVEKTQPTETALEKWKSSAEAWITDQGELGDWSRRVVLDPALETLLPDVSGMNVLDLGCGEGRYSRVLTAKGARVTGVDPVPQFIALARQRDPDSIYIEAQAEELPLETGAFDLVLSYLSIVDIADIDAASREICRVINPNGKLIIVNISNLASTTDGWHKDENGNKTHRTVDRYMEHLAMDLEWRNIRIRNYHRPLSYILGKFLNNGFVLTDFVEPLPPEADRNYEFEFRVPNFQIYSLRRIRQGNA